MTYRGEVIMNKNSLVEAAECYEGQYVTTCGANSKIVISSSESPVIAMNSAKEKGCTTPVLIYVPKKSESTFIY